MKKTKRFLVILIISILLFEFIISNSCVSYAASGNDAEFAVGNKVANLITNLGGGIISILLWLPKLKATALLIVIDSSVAFLSTIGGDGSGFFITPYDIFFNKFKLLDVNFFDIDGIEEDTIIHEIRTHVSGWYYAMRLIAAAILLVVLIYVGIRMAISSVADEKAKYKKMLWDWVCSLALLFVIQYIAIFVIYFNQATVNALDSAFKNVSGDNAIAGLALEALLGIGLRSIVAFLVFVGILAQTIFFFIGYFNRVLKVGFLLLISPLITLTYSIDKMGDGKAQALGNWLKEFIFTILIQPFHCIVYMAFINVAFELVGFTLNLEYINDLFNVNQLAQGFLAILCIKFVNDGEKIVRKIFGFADDNSKTSFAAGAVATVAAVKTVSNAGEKASKMINNTKVSMAKFGEHYKKDSGKLNEIFGGMKDKVPSGVKNSLGKGAEKAKSISSKVGNKFSKSKKKINGKKTSTSEKYKSKRGAKIRDKMMKRANHLTVAAIAGMATYATGSTDAMTALGIGYATKKTADGLFDKTSKNLITQDSKTNFEEDERKFTDLTEKLGENLKDAQEKFQHFDEIVKNYQDADTSDNEADDLEKQAQKLDNQIKNSPKDPDIDKKKEQLKNMQDRIKELREKANKSRDAAKEKDKNGNIKKFLDNGEDVNKIKEKYEEVANFWSKDSIVKRLSERHESSSKKDLENKANEIQQEIVSILRKRRKIDLADNEELPEEFLTAEDKLGKSLTKIMTGKVETNLLSSKDSDSSEIVKEMGFGEDEGLKELVTQYQQILAVNKFSENTDQSEDFGYTENGYYKKVSEQIIARNDQNKSSRRK